MSSNLLADNVPEPIQEPVAVTVNPVQEPVTVNAVADAEQTPTVQTPLTVQATPARVLPSSYLDTPSHSGSTFAEKAKTSSNSILNYLEEDDRPSRRTRRLPKSHPYKYPQEEDD